LDTQGAIAHTYESRPQNTRHQDNLGLARKDSNLHKSVPTTGPPKHELLEPCCSTCFDVISQLRHCCCLHGWLVMFTQQLSIY